MIEAGAAASWYVVRTNHKQEALARASLNAERFETYLPLLGKLNKNGDLYGAPFFPGFVFARLAIGTPGWSRVFAARGVASVLGVGGRPSVLHDRVVEVLREREHDGFLRLGLAGETVCRHHRGDPIKLRKGPFAALDAIFVEALDKQRCVILIRLLGESQRLAHAHLAHIE